MDNTTLPANGTVVAADDIGGIKFQRMKPTWGDPGNAVDTSVAAPLPVQIISVPGQDSVTEGITLLRRMLAVMKPFGVITGGGSNRLSIDINNITGGALESVGTVTTVTGVTTVNTVSSVSTVQNQAQMGGITAFDLMKAMSRTAYNSGIRSNIS